MAVSKVNFFQSTDAAASVSTAAIGDLLIVDVQSSTAGVSHLAPTFSGVSGGWIQVGTTISQASGFILSSSRWLGAASSVVTSQSLTAGFGSSSPNYKIDCTTFTAGLGPTTLWTVDTHYQGLVTTTTTTPIGDAMTSTTTNSIAYQIIVPQFGGSAGATAGWTYVVDTSWTNILAHRSVSATGSVAAAGANQSPAGQYIKRGLIIQASLPAVSLRKGSFFPFF